MQYVRQSVRRMLGSPADGRDTAADSGNLPYFIAVFFSA